MQNLILKSLVLIGVIGGSCYVVYKAQTGIQEASKDADPTTFKSVQVQEDGPDDQTAEGDLFSNVDLVFPESPDGPPDGNTESANSPLKNSGSGSSAGMAPIQFDSEESSQFGGDSSVTPENEDGRPLQFAAVEHSENGGNTEYEAGSPLAFPVTALDDVQTHRIEENPNGLLLPNNSPEPPASKNYPALNAGEYVPTQRYFNPRKQPVAEADEVTPVGEPYDLSFESDGIAIDSKTSIAESEDAAPTLRPLEGGIPFGPRATNERMASETVHGEAEATPQPLFLPQDDVRNAEAATASPLENNAVLPAENGQFYGSVEAVSPDDSASEVIEVSGESGASPQAAELLPDSLPAFSSLPEPEPLTAPVAGNPFENYTPQKMENEQAPIRTADTGFDVPPPRTALPVVENDPFGVGRVQLANDESLAGDEFHVDPPESNRADESLVLPSSDSASRPMSNDDSGRPGSETANEVSPVIPSSAADELQDSLDVNDQSAPSFGSVGEVVLPEVSEPVQAEILEQPFAAGQSEDILPTITPSRDGDVAVGERENRLPVIRPAGRSPAPTGNISPSNNEHSQVNSASRELSTGIESSSSVSSEPAATVDENLIGQGTLSEDVASGPQSPELTIEKRAPQTATIGEKLIYSIIVKNVGGSEARSLVVEDRIPRGTRLEGTIPQAVLSDGVLTWNRPRLQPGEVWEIQLLVVPLEAGELGSVATVSFESAVAAMIEVTAPKIEMEMTGPVEAVVGTNVPYQFTIHNTGKGKAKDVYLRTILPDELTHPGGQDIEYRIGDLGPGETRNVDLIVQTATAGAPTVEAIITANGQNQAKSSADLRIIQSRLRVATTGPQRGFVGRGATFRIQVTNDSSQPLAEIQLAGQIPKGSDLTDQLPGWNALTREVTWTIPQLSPGETKDFSVSMIPKNDGEQLLKLTARDRAGNEATVSSTLKVKGFADLDVDITGASRTALVGEQVSFRLNLRNGGTASASAVQARFEIPEGLAFASAQGPSAYQISGNVLRFEPLQEVQVGSEQAYDIVLTAAEACDSKLLVELESADFAEPVKLEEPIRVIRNE